MVVWAGGWRMVFIHWYRGMLVCGVLGGLRGGRVEGRCLFMGSLI